MGQLLRSSLQQVTERQMQSTYMETPGRQMEASSPGIVDQFEISRGSAEVARRTHNPEVGGSNPSPATTLPIHNNIILGYN